MAVFKPTGEDTRKGMYEQTKQMMFNFASIGEGASPRELADDVHLLMRAMTQKTAGQQPYAKANDVDFRDLDAIELRILAGAIALVNSNLFDSVLRIYGEV